MTTSAASPAETEDRLSEWAQKVRPETWIMAGIGLILALQFSEIFRRGINWDEFAHYNQLWEYERGNVTRAFNTLYIHAFGWVRDLGGSAVDHIIVIRLFMYVCELVTICAVVGLAQRFTNRATGLLCALAYVTFPFVFGHGYSFRFDPPATALMISALGILCLRPIDWKTIIVAGILIGTGLMTTLKIVLLLPAFAGVLWLRWDEARYAPSFVARIALVGALAIGVAGAIFAWQSLGNAQNAVEISASRASGASSVLLAFEAKPYWITAGVAAIKAPLVTALIALFGYCLYVSERTKAEKIALVSLFFTLTTLIYYHNTAPYFYVFLMPWVLIACSIPMQWVSQRFSPVFIAFIFTFSGLATYAFESESPIDKQRTLIAAAYETFPEGTAYFDFMGMIARYPKANDFVTPLNVKRQHAEGRSIYTEALAEKPVPVLLRNDWQFDALFYDPANPPSLPGGLAIFTPTDAKALVDTYIPFWGPFMIAGEVIPAGETSHSFMVRVPGPYTLRGPDVSIDGQAVSEGEVIELRRGAHKATGVRDSDSKLIWASVLLPRSPGTSKSYRADLVSPAMSAEPLHPFSSSETQKAKEQGATLRWYDLLAKPALRAKAAIGKYRSAILVAAFAFFIGGLVWAVRALGLSLSDLNVYYIVLSGFVIIPIAFVNGAMSMTVMARTAGIKISFVEAFKINCVAQFAEFLPVPGGAIVRGGALVKGGSSAGSAGLHVIVNALLWVAASAVAAGLVLGIGTPFGLVIAASGGVTFAACALWLTAQGGAALALASIAIRLIGLLIGGARIFLAFLAISVATSFFEIYPFVFATLLGSAASIVPGGLGVSEFTSAALANLSAIAPEAAFLAVGLNRVVGFAISGLATGVIALFSSNNGSRTS